MNDVHFVVPAGIDDPLHPSGGNVYDRRLCQELTGLGWTVHEHLGTTDIPDGSVVLVDGLVASSGLVPEKDRLRIVVLLHMPVGDEQEREILDAAAAVVTTSEWARRQVPGRRATVALPGTDPKPAVAGSTTGSNLLCVGAVIRAKGHDVLLAALAKVTHLDWRCTIVGALDLEPDFAAELGATERVRFTGPLTGQQLDAVFDESDLLVSASRRESYGMAVTEALARGIPVVTTDVGGLPEAVGPSSDGSGPGLLFPDEDVDALAGHLKAWLTDEDLRARLRRAAAGRRTTLGTWTQTAQRVAEVLAGC